MKKGQGYIRAGAVIFFSHGAAAARKRRGPGEASHLRGKDNSSDWEQQLGMGGS